MTPRRLAIVTATSNAERSTEIRYNWCLRADQPVALYTVVNGFDGQAVDWINVGVGTLPHWMLVREDYLGTVPAFALGVARALEDGAEIIACLHDDLDVLQFGWDTVVLEHFDQHPTCGLLGFGGGRGLGAANIYQVPYDPMQLARQDFISNMKDAESHGRRVVLPQRAAALDGFSQIGRRDFWEGLHRLDDGVPHSETPVTNLFQQMASWGVVHHFYDGMLGCFAARLGWEVWMLPIACHHYGGLTAVGDPRYQQWANHNFYRSTLDFGNRRVEDVRGDQLFWEQAHQIGYEQFRDVLPIRLKEDV